MQSAPSPGHRRPLHLQQPRLPSLGSKFSEYIPVMPPRIPAYRSLGILEQLGLDRPELEGAYQHDLFPSPMDEYPTHSRAPSLASNDSVAHSSSIHAFSEDFGRPFRYSPVPESHLYEQDSYASMHDAPNQYLPESSQRSRSPRGQPHAPLPPFNLSPLVNPSFEYPEIKTKYLQESHQGDVGQNESHPPTTSNDWQRVAAAEPAPVATMHPYYQSATLQEDQNQHAFLPPERFRKEPPREEPPFAPTPARERSAVQSHSSYYLQRVLGPDLHGYYPDTPLFLDPSYAPMCGSYPADGYDGRNSEREIQLVHGAWPAPISHPVIAPSESALFDERARFQFASQVSSMRRRHPEVAAQGEADPPLTPDDDESPFPSFKFDAAPESIDPNSLDLVKKSQPAAPSRSGYGLRTHSATVAAFSSYQPPMVSHKTAPPSPTTIKAASSIASLASDSHSYATSSTREEPHLEAAHATRSHASLPPIKVKCAAPPLKATGTKKRKPCSPSSDDSDDGQQSPSRKPAEAPSGNALQTTKPDANLLVAWNHAEGKFLPDDQAGADLERILLTVDEFVRVWAAPAVRERGRGDRPMIEVFPWSDDGGLTWIQGQHRNKPACPCGIDYYSSNSEASKPKLKSGDILREHVVRCSRVAGDTGLKKLCRKLEQGKGTPSKPEPVKKRRTFVASKRA